MALTVEELYQQYAGRASDAEGLAYWQQQFGSTIEPAEALLFSKIVAENDPTSPAATGIAAAPAPAPTASPAPAPAPAASSAIENLYQKYTGQAGDPEGLAYWQSQFGDTVDSNEASLFQKILMENRPPETIAQLYQQVLGRAPESQDVIDNWSKNFQSNTIDAQSIDKFIRAAQPELNGASQPLLKAQILAQGTSGNWSGEGFGSADANANAMAEILMNIGIKDIKEFGKLPDGSFGNLTTGMAVPNTYGERQTGDAFGGTYAGSGNTGFRAQFMPDGTPVFYTNGQSSNTLANILGDSKILNLAANAAAAYFGGPLGTGALQLAQGNSIGDAAKAALLAYGGQQVSGALGGGGSSGVSTISEAGFQAADAAQLAAQGLGEAQIASTLVSSGMSDAGASLAASMAANGLSVDMMTQQLDALSTNTGLMSQTDNPAGFAAADSLQLQGQVGNNFAAIEQNLIASGVDPLIAADISQQIAFNPNITQAELETALSKSYGGNIYDVNMATTYPTSVLPGTGGLLSDVPGAAAGGGTTPATPATPSTPTTGTGLTNEQIANIIKAGVSLTGLGAGTGLLSNGLGGGSGTSFQAPTQQPPTYGADYFNQIQQNYNSYLPQTPRDVATPLQQWYNPTKAV